MQDFQLDKHQKTFGGRSPAAKRFLVLMRSPDPLAAQRVPTSKGRGGEGRGKGGDREEGEGRGNKDREQEGGADGKGEGWGRGGG